MGHFRNQVAETIVLANILPAVVLMDSKVTGESVRSFGHGHGILATGEILEEWVAAGVHHLHD